MNADWPEAAFVVFVAEVFRLWWNESFDRKAIDALIVAALIRVVGRPNGERVLLRLIPAIRMRFGLDVIGAQHVTEVIRAWSATRLSR